MPTDKYIKRQTDSWRYTIYKLVIMVTLSFYILVVKDRFLGNV